MTHPSPSPQQGIWGNLLGLRGRVYVRLSSIHSQRRRNLFGVIFDGTTRLGEAMTIILQYVSDSWTLEQRLVRIQLLSKSITGEEIAREFFQSHTPLVVINLLQL